MAQTRKKKAAGVPAAISDLLFEDAQGEGAAAPAGAVAGYS
jgi:hypothetical protein